MGAWFSSLYRDIHYIKVRYIKVWVYLYLFIPGMNIRPINIEFNKHGYFVHHSCIRCKVGQRFLFSFPGIKVCRFAANVECDSTWKRMGFVKYIYIQSGRMRNYFNKKIIFSPQFILFKFFSSNKKIQKGLFGSNQRRQVSAT